jgi:hypothetical protein
MTVYKNAKVYSGGYDLTGATNTVSVDYAFDELDATTYGSDCRFSVPGLAKLSFSMEGFAYSDGTDEPEDVLYAALGNTTAQPVTWAPLTGADGEFAYSAETLALSYSMGGTIGELCPFIVSGAGKGSKLFRGTILGTGAKSSTANGTARQLGAVSATQYLYGCLHVLAVSGTSPTLDVVVKSDDAEGFSSGTTRLTFAQKTAIGSEFITPVAGPITDDWFRATWTIGGSGSPSFTIALVVGIL